MIFMVESSDKGKCVSCEHYQYKNGDWTWGLCTNPYAKVKNRQRDYNQKCSQWRRKKEANHDL